MVLLKEFFVKYKPELDLMTALKMAENRLYHAKKDLKKAKDEEDKEYLKHLAEAYLMLEDIFEELGVDPETL